MGYFLLLPDNFLLLQNDFLLAAILIDMIGQDEAVHDQCRQGKAEINNLKNVSKEQYDQRDHNRQKGNETCEKDFTGKTLSVFDRPDEIDEQDSERQQQEKRVQGSAVILIFRCDIEETIDESRAGIYNILDSKQADHGVKKF